MSDIGYLMGKQTLLKVQIGHECLFTYERDLSGAPILRFDV